MNQTSKRLTWAEFKDNVDKQLKELGISEMQPIFTIDLIFTTTEDKIEIWLDERGLSINDK